MKSSDYWRKREEEWIKQQIKEDAKQSKIIAEKYQKALDQIEKEISANWERFAGKEGVTLSDAKKMALEMDVKAFARKAKEYVKNKDFSKTANDELRLYNVTMRTNRLELLKSQIGLELIALSDEMDKYTAETLTKTGLKEAERQAGILGETVFSNYKTFVGSVALGSFQGATFSERIWGNNGALKADLDRLLIRSVTQGRNPRELARELRNLFDSSKYEAERLMRTETARVQVAIQEKSYQEYGIEEFEFVAEPSACGLCKPLDGKTFKVSKMTVGLNAPPIHPHCRCSTVPSVDREVLERRLAEIDKTEKTLHNTREGQFVNELKDYKMSRNDAIAKLKDEFDMDVSEASRTKLSETALNQTYGVLKAFENIYNALPEKIPLVRAITKSKAKNTIAWYSKRGASNTPIEFGINVGYFNGDKALRAIVDANIKNGWFSKNADPNHIVVHEFGHHIDFQLSKLYGGRFADAVLTRMVNDYGDNYDLRTIAKATGGYASSYYGRTGQHSETFAELFAEAYGNTPRNIAKDFKTEFEKMAKELIDDANKT